VPASAPPLAMLWPMSDETLTAEQPYVSPPPAQPVWGLAIAWSRDAPERIGEVFVLEGAEAELGRGDGGEAPRMVLWRIRAGDARPQPPLVSRTLSRRQLVVRGGRQLRITQAGKTPLKHRGRVVTEAVLHEGDVVEVENVLVLVAVRRQLSPAPLPRAYPTGPYGEADGFGMVGESTATWRLRSAVTSVAEQPGHVLVTGPSGAGKELVAAALHGLSERSGPLVARNAATIPAALAEAELFGNRANYPNPGMPERPGLIGQADGGTLLLDELGDLPSSVQAGLLRVLDAGEYQRLGEARTRRSNLRVIGATHRGPEALKHDLRARFRHHLEVPGLADRPTDVPLLARHLLREASRQDPRLLRFFEGATPRLTPRFVHGLLRGPWETNVRQLDAHLWEQLRTTDDPFLDAPEPPWTPVATTDPRSLDAATIRQALADCDGVVSHAWKALGLSSRDQLRRLMKKHGL